MNTSSDKPAEKPARKPLRASTSSLDRLSSKGDQTRLDESISRLIETHDNTFQCTPPLIAALDGKFSHTDRFGRTPACLAASLGKKRLAQAIIKLGGGHRILDIRQMNAEDYLALADEHFSAQAQTQAQIEAFRIEGKIEHRTPHPAIHREPKNEES